MIYFDLSPINPFLGHGGVKSAQNDGDFNPIFPVPQILHNKMDGHQNVQPEKIFKIRNFYPYH